MNEQLSLFVDPEKLCTACRGTGKQGLSWDERGCFGCGGTGFEKDRPDPHTMPIPYGEADT